MIDSEQLKQNVVKAVEEIRATNPMAGSITNTVTIDFVANAQLAVGGSAAMVYLPDEGEALVAGGGAIYLNMGTLFPIYEQTIPRAAKAAHDAGKPWVLDPVGLGIGSLRTQLVNELKQYKPAIVRGNASEIIALAGLWGLEGEAADLSRVRGVDTTDTVDAARDAAVGRAPDPPRARVGGGGVAQMPPRPPLAPVPAKGPSRPTRSETALLYYLVCSSRMLTAPASCAARICSARWVSPQPLPCHRSAAGA